MSNRKINFFDYKKCLRRDHNVDSQTEKYYETAANKLIFDFQQSPFWKELTDNKKLRDFDEDYRLTHNGYPLLLDHKPPELKCKSFESLLLKPTGLMYYKMGIGPRNPKKVGSFRKIVLKKSIISLEPVLLLNILMA